MHQSILPLIPQGATKINNMVSVWRDEEKWTYFLGTHPIYSHRAKDLRLFRFITAQLIESGSCSQVEILKAFGVSKSSVIRSQKKLKEGGVEAFFQPRRTRSGGPVLTREVLEKAQALLDQGDSRRDISEELNVRYDTLRKAINDGRLHETTRKESVLSKSSRNEIDTSAAEGMGTACTRVIERTFAAFGLCEGVPMRFELCLDVPNGGVLCALPALLANGLLKNVEELLGKVKGYYSVFHVLLLLAFMSLCRIKTVEQLRGRAPGEFGKLLGLDRIPEVRCLRKKMDTMSSEDAAERWATYLGKYWMEIEPETVGTLYIDGHVRVYHGGLTKPPRRYVSRDRLCLRGTTDYWVNDAVGLPFFVIEKPIDPGLLKTLHNDIIPRLLNDIPNQPTDRELSDNPHRCRFVLVFDREGYSPVFFHDMWVTYRIACLTYHKHPGKAWPEEWFAKYEVTMPRGEIVKMRLAEMGSLVGSGKNTLWMKEVRKLTDSGHQTSLISTAYELTHTKLSANMFSRWCQENFFRYMMRHYAIDLLQEYGTEEILGTEKVVNPKWRELNRENNSVQNKLRYRRARFAEMTMHPEDEQNPSKYRKWLKKKSELLEQIEQFEYQLNEVKTKMKGTPRHIAWDDLDEEDKFYRLPPNRKRLMDTVHMIAYRAETAMIGLLGDKNLDTASARRLLHDLFITEADILPEPENKLLRIRIHAASRPAVNLRLISLFEEINKAEIKYPTTDLNILYELSGWDSEKVKKVSR